MKYLQTIRKLHLWLGLVLSVFLLIEATTGLILAEPMLIGANKAYPAGSVNTKIGGNNSDTNQPENVRTEHLSQVSGEVNILVFIKQIHQGIIYNKNFRWIIDITAVSIIILTLTGIYLSAPVLRATAKKKNNDQAT
jgi:hypothetical protein